MINLKQNPWWFLKFHKSELSFRRDSDFENIVAEMVKLDSKKSIYFTILKACLSSYIWEKIFVLHHHQAHRNVLKFIFFPINS